MFIFWPIHQLGHAENLLNSYEKQTHFFDRVIQKKINLNFENTNTGIWLWCLFENLLAGPAWNVEFHLETYCGSHTQLQCFLFSRIIGQLTPKIIYFYYLKKYFLDQSIQKIFYLILKKEAEICYSRFIG